MVFLLQKKKTNLDFKGWQIKMTAPSLDTCVLNGSVPLVLLSGEFNSIAALSGRSLLQGIESVLLPFI